MYARVGQQMYARVGQEMYARVGQEIYARVGQETDTCVGQETDARVGQEMNARVGRVGVNMWSPSRNFISHRSMCKKPVNSCLYSKCQDINIYVFHFSFYAIRGNDEN